VSRLATSFVLGYHGCEQMIADRAILGEIDIYIVTGIMIGLVQGPISGNPIHNAPLNGLYQNGINTRL
jgi:hypothetical protein